MKHIVRIHNSSAHTHTHTDTHAHTHVTFLVVVVVLKWYYFSAGGTNVKSIRLTYIYKYKSLHFPRCEENARGWEEAVGGIGVRWMIGGSTGRYYDALSYLLCTLLRSLQTQQNNHSLNTCTGSIGALTLCYDDFTETRQQSASTFFQLNV